MRKFPYVIKIVQKEAKYILAKLRRHLFPVQTALLRRLKKKAGKNKIHSK